MNSLALSSPQPSGFLARIRKASPLLWRMSLVFLAAFAVCVALQAVDGRLLNGISVWIKPAKFFLSVAVQMLTLAWGISLLPEDKRTTRAVAWPALYFVAAAVFELTYITGRAGLGEASHFNTATPLSELLYSLMGLAAIGMMLATGWLGFRILRDAPKSVAASAAGWGFLLAMPATIVVGLTLGGLQSHWIGGDLTDATGLPVMGWSTTGGDLRVSHFFALHLSQTLPLAAWLGGARLAWIAAAVGLAAISVTYVQALMGFPLIAF